LLRKYIAEKRKNEEPPFWGMRYWVFSGDPSWPGHAE
jgi:hypothetical protein